MNGWIGLLKNGNRSALMAAIVNLIISVLKAGAFFLTGNVAMYAEMMHSLGDAANQLFVYTGSALSKKAPTPKFPNGFGRIVNLVCLGAVLVVAILSYETIIEGIHHILHPAESTGLLINLGVLGLGIVLESFVLYKASKEVMHDAGLAHNGISSLPKSFAHLSKAKPPTKLVFMEDLVATSGGVIAFIAVLLAHFLGWTAAEGIASIAIGGMMFYVVGKVFLENARGAIGETDEEMLAHIAHLVAEDPDIVDIQRVEVVKEGESLHVEIVAEVSTANTVEYVLAVKDRLMTLVLSQKGIQDVIISLIGDDGIQSWNDTNSSRLIENRKKLPE
ncbi:cation diffusion facilitator family transporter [Sporosarcina trichiuri]|uniref:cation diffusion facilitator family transporter n=1 Tax=Sporosarcina trichiuri TaxID=3056445 RepID=UPI0025B5955A|nr:cation diffusion facilitator family transporter [Sporosarcina sp. 0.2-SM1T-5]WJY27811.1 cation diffusion facilitator family transporter [Sporosarcina sp. 0.2-SM1T-5]